MSSASYFAYWYTILILSYLLGCVIFAAGSTYVPGFEIKWDVLRWINYSQGTNTYYVQPVKYLMQMFTILHGFVFVNKAVLINEKYISGKKAEYYDTKMILMVQSVFFIVTGNINFRGRYDKTEF